MPKFVKKSGPCSPKKQSKLTDISTRKIGHRQKLLMILPNNLLMKGNRVRSVQKFACCTTRKGCILGSSVTTPNLIRLLRMKCGATGCSGKMITFISCLTPMAINGSASSFGRMPSARCQTPLSLMEAKTSTGVGTASGKLQDDNTKKGGRLKLRFRLINCGLRKKIRWYGV